MKDISIKAYQDNEVEMNDLFDTVANLMELDNGKVRDKFKMVSKVTRTNLLNFCEENNIKVELDFTGKKKNVKVFLSVKNDVYARVISGDKSKPSEDKPEEIKEPLKNKEEGSGDLEDDGDLF